jgi:GNAT superfamily N-acetyltransferase
MPDIYDSILNDGNDDPINAVLAATPTRKQSSFAPPSLPKPPLPSGLAPSSSPWISGKAPAPFAPDEVEAEGQRKVGETVVEYSPIGGVPQIGHGAKTVWNAKTGRERAQGARDVLAGVGKSLAPMALPAAYAAPVATAVGIGGGMAVQAGTQKGLEAAGVPEEYAGLAGDVAGFIPPGAVAPGIVRGLRPKATAPIVEIPSPRPLESIPDAGPVPKGPQIKSARESAEVLARENPPVFKSASDSAAVFERAASEQARKQAKRIEVPETGVPENVARAADARERIAMQVANKPWAQLDNSERIVIDALVSEGNTGASAVPEPASPRRRAGQRGSWSEKDAKRTEATAEAVVTRPIGANRLMPSEEVRSIHRQVVDMPITNPSAAPGSSFKYSIVETGTPANARKRFLIGIDNKGDRSADAFAFKGGAFVDDKGNVEAFYVDPDVRGTGLFHKLMDFVESKGHSVAPDAPKSISAIKALAKRREGQRGSISLKPTEARANPPAPEPEDLLNYRRLGLSEASYKLLQNRTAEFQEKTGYEKPHTTFGQVESRAAEILPELEQRLNVPTQEQILTDQGTMLAGRRALTTLSNETARITERLKDRASMRPSEVAGLENQLGQYRKDMQDLIGKVTRIRTKAGQDLAFWRIVAEETKDPWDAAQWVSRVDKMHGDAAPDKVKTDLLGLLDRGRAAQAKGDPNAPEVKEAKHDLAKFLAEQQRMGVLETISYLIRGGLLTGPGGAARDIVGTGLNQALEEAARIPASIVDAALSMRTGNRTTSGLSWQGFTESVRAAGHGVKQIPTLVKHGVPDSALEKLEAIEKAPAKFADNSPILRKYFDAMKTVYRVRGAIDAPSYEFALKRALYSQGQAEARNASKHLKGGEQARFQRDFVQDYVNNPSEAAAAQAIAAAEFATFRNETSAYRAIRAGRRQFGSVGQFVTDMVIPFTRATTAIGYRVAEYAGGGLAEGSGRLIKGAIDGQLSPEQQKLASEAIGRGVIGPTLIYLGYVLGEKGLMTGTSQETEGARERDTAVGRPPMALRVGDKWMQIGGIAPVGNLLALGATLQREGIRPLKDPGKRLDVQVGAGVRTVLEQPYFQGAEEMIDFVKSPGRNAGRMAASKAGMVVPTIVGNVAEATDPVQRERSRESIGSQVATGVQSRIPGARQMLPPRLDVLGKPVASAGASALSPFRMSPAREANDPVARALVADQVALSRSDKKPGESEAEHRLRTETQGKAIGGALNRAITSPAYKRLDTEDERRDYMKKQIDKSRDRVNKLTSSKRYQRMGEQDRIQQLTMLGQRIERAR